MSLEAVDLTSTEEESSSSKSNGKQEQVADPVFTNLPRSKLRPSNEQIDNSLLNKKLLQPILKTPSVKFSELENESRQYIFKPPNPEDPDFAKRIMEARQSFADFKRQQENLREIKRETGGMSGLLTYLAIAGVVGISFYFGYKYVFPIFTSSANTDIKTE